MARSIDSDTEAKNTIDPDRLKKIIADIEEKIDAKLSHKMEYVESCKAYNEAITNAYELGSAFVSKKVLKAKIRERELYRKIEGVTEDLEDEQRETFDMISQALGGFGDLPLGKAALDAASDSDKKPLGRPRKAPSSDHGEDDADLRPAHLQRNDRDREAVIAEENGKRLKDGIKTLSH